MATEPAGRLTVDLGALAPRCRRMRCGPARMVTLIGGPDGVDELAAAAGTIGYEVLTRLGSRFARRYIPPGPL